MTRITIKRFLPYHKQTWSRLAVEGDLRSIYIFTDNTDRTSGSGPIDPNSWYCKEFGEGKKFPSRTTACIRGCHNAFPITTQKYYKHHNDYKLDRWEDSDINEFKEVIDKDINRIKDEIIKWHPQFVWYPNGGFFFTNISYITPQRCPLIYNYLKSKLDELEEFINTYSKKTTLF